MKVCHLHISSSLDEIFVLFLFFITTLNTHSLAVLESGTAERALEGQHLPAWETSACHRYEKYCSLWKLCYCGSGHWRWAVSMRQVTSFSPWWPQEISFQQRLQWNTCGLPFAGTTQGHFISQAGSYLDLYERFPAFLATSAAVCCRGCF